MRYWMQYPQILEHKPTKETFGNLLDSDQELAKNLPNLGICTNSGRI